ncbi:hypothetical protein ACTXKF_17750 [Vreelandella alkaliphila]|uniref:hypothetical protein n=1 Tax=Vreelandella alkaliphila TaxID=272774 RepID=UPI003FD896DC
MALCTITSPHYQQTRIVKSFVVCRYLACYPPLCISLLRISTLNCRAAVFVPADNAEEVRS